MVHPFAGYCWICILSCSVVVSRRNMLHKKRLDCFIVFFIARWFLPALVAIWDGVDMFLLQDESQQFI